MVQWAVSDITSSDNVGASGSLSTRHRSSESPYRCRATTCTRNSTFSTVSHPCGALTRWTDGRQPCSAPGRSIGRGETSHTMHATANARDPPSLTTAHQGVGTGSARRVHSLQCQLPHGKSRLPRSRCRRRLPGALAHGRATRPRYHRAHHRRTHSVAAHACTVAVAMSRGPSRLKTTSKALPSERSKARRDALHSSSSTGEPRRGSYPREPNIRRSAVERRKMTRSRNTSVVASRRQR
jgi:hypothetical protein